MQPLLEMQKKAAVEWKIEITTQLSEMICNPEIIFVEIKMQKQSNCVQVVMGYGHNKLSLEEAEELLKEVNHS